MTHVIGMSLPVCNFFCGFRIYISCDVDCTLIMRHVCVIAVFDVVSLVSHVAVFTSVLVLSSLVGSLFTV